MKSKLTLRGVLDTRIANNDCLLAAKNPRLCVGTPSSFLPIIHSALVQYSLPLAEWLVTQGYSLYSKSDLKFTEGFYRVLRDAFNYRPRLSKEQFLAKGYAERKVMLTHDLLLLCQDRHAKLTPTDRKRARR